MSYRGSKLNGNERKWCPEISTWQIDMDSWDFCSGAAQLLGQCCGRRVVGAAGEPWLSSAKPGSLHGTLETLAVLPKGVAGTLWPPILAALWLRTAVLTTLWPDLTAVHGSTLESLQHTALFLKDTLRHKVKWMSTRNSAGSLRVIQSREKYKLLFLRPWHLTQKWIIRWKKKKSSQTAS